MASAERQGMSIRKFRCELPERIVPGTDVTLDRSEETHLFKILRAVPGDVVELLDGHGRIADAEVKPGRLLTVRKIRQAEIPPRRIHLYIAPPRRQKMDTVLREATELGVWRIVPVILRIQRIGTRCGIGRGTLDGCDVRSLQAVRKSVSSGNLFPADIRTGGRRCTDELSGAPFRFSGTDGFRKQPRGRPRLVRRPGRRFLRRGRSVSPAGWSKTAADRTMDPARGDRRNRRNRKTARLTVF